MKITELHVYCEALLLKSGIAHRKPDIPAADALNNEY